MSETTVGPAVEADAVEGLDADPDDGWVGSWGAAACAWSSAARLVCPALDTAASVAV